MYCHFQFCYLDLFKSADLANSAVFVAAAFALSMTDWLVCKALLTIDKAIDVTGLPARAWCFNISFVADRKFNRMRTSMVQDFGIPAQGFGIPSLTLGLLGC